MKTVAIERRPRVLLVDDYQPLLVAWRRLLEPWCDVVGSVSNGREVIKVAVQCKPNVIVLDLNMPELNILDVCSTFKQVRPQIGVVLVSAADDPDLRRVAFKLGASSFVSKYLAASELEPAIRRAFREGA